MNKQSVLKKFCDVSTWRSISALNLNLMQSFKTALGETVWIDELRAKTQFKQFMNLLNRAVFRSAYRRHGKRLRVIPILERSPINRRFHYHVAFEPPAHLNNDEFCDLAMSIWQSTPLGYGYGDATPYADAGWIDYITKHKSKSGFEHYFDCIDTDAFCNPVADA